MSRLRVLALAAFASALVLLTACGGDDATSTPAASKTASATASTAPSTSPTPAEGTPATTATSGATEQPSAEPSEEPSSESTDEPSAEPTEVASEEPVGSGGGCQGKITGDLTQEFSGPGGSSAVGTDYWYTDDEMREILKQFAGFGGDLTEEQIAAQVEEDMKKDPRLFLLLLNCVASDGSVSLTLSPSGTSKYADVPFEPGSYKIAGGGILGGSDVPAEFGVLLSVGTGSFSVTDAGGTLDITKFDNSGIAGTFSFPAEEIFAEDGTAQKITVEGSFDYECVGQSVCD